MRRRATTAAPLLALALSACTSLKDPSPGTVVTCASASECPAGRVCNRGRCVNPDVIDTTPPDLVAGSAAVSPPRVRAGQPFTVTLEVTEPLEAPPAVALALVPPVLLSCAATSAVAWACTHAATGAENGGLGGDIGVDVRMTDRSGNDTARSGVATVTLDFAPPWPTLASVAYYPAPSNVLPAVRTATGGTLVRVAVSADERLSASAPPALVGRLGAATLPFSLEPGDAGAVDAVFATTVPAGLPDGDYALEVAWTDEVGNVGTATVPAVARVKTSRPTLWVDQAEVVFVRSPWGNAAPEELGGYVIPAGPYFALDPADPLAPATCLPAGTFLLDGGVVPERLQVRAGAMVVGTLQPDGAGRWPRQPLASPDAYTVHVVGFDDAGNASDPRAIANVEWVATSNLPPIGTTPHTLLRTPRVDASRVQRTEVDRVPEGDVGGADGAAALAIAQGVWREMSFPPPPLRPIDQAAVAYDSARGRVVMFGGRLSSSLLQTVAEWDGRTWVDVTPPSGSPPARQSPALAYDAARGRVVLFGGTRNVGGIQTGFSDTWEWDGTRWEQRAPAASPPPRGEAAMAYDGARRRVVLHGGWEGGALGDTWEWDGTSWTSVTPAGATPGPLAGHALAYDPARGRTVLVSGAAGAPVWEWDGASWTGITPAGARPEGTAIAYVHDGARGRVVLFGTWTDAGGAHPGVWEWDGASWTTVAVPAAAPVFADHAVAHDVARGRTVLHTGRYAGAQDGTWEWDGAAWTNVTPTGRKPPPRYMYENALAYDAGRRRTVLWGGAAALDTWEWDGANWTSVAPAASGPPQWSSGLAYDAGRRRTAVISGAQTWGWDGTAWTAVTPATYQADGTLVYDGARAQLIAFDAYGAWRWTGADWVAMPGPGVSGLATFDAARGRVVVWNPAADDPVWEWSGSAWASVAPGAAAPSSRGSAAMTYDAERGRAVLFGGMGCGSVCQDTWEWDGSAWRDATPAGTKPPARRFLALAHDSGRHRTVLFSGNDVGGDISWDDTWELEARLAGRPAIQFDASTARTGIAPASIAGLRVRAWAGGAFTIADPGATGAAGATLRAWATHSADAGPGGWVPLATTGAGAAATPPYLGPPAATRLEWAGGAGEAARLVTERDGQLSFQVVPSGTMGPDPGGARVALDYVEVRVRYAAVP